MTYGSVCSGIEATTVAWEPLGLYPAWFAEIDPFCSALLEYHYPKVKNHGDFTQITETVGAVDILAGGTPCQSFSISGKRGGLDDARGNLAIEFCRLAARLRPRWVVWENVPGVLSSNAGRDFGAILKALAELGYGCAWRVLDAQFFGVPQRRRRVFVVGHLGDWRRAAAVLFDPWDVQNAAAENEAAKQENAAGNGTGSGGDAETSHGVIAASIAGTLLSTSKGGRRPGHAGDDLARGMIVLDSMGPRILTPRECERLQGLPDDYTLVPFRGKPAPDGQRYRAIGNSMAVPVMRWIGRRILIADGINRTHSGVGYGAA